MKTQPRDFIDSCMESLTNRTQFLISKIESSDKELHFFKAELKALQYALALMRHELMICEMIESRIKDRNSNGGLNV